MALCCRRRPAVTVNEIGTVYDRRVFAGQYAQLDWKPDKRWDVIGGIRLNEAYEHKDSSDLTLPPPMYLRPRPLVRR